MFLWPRRRRKSTASRGDALREAKRLSQEALKGVADLAQRYRKAEAGIAVTEAIQVTMRS